MLEIRVHGVSNTPPQSMLQEYDTDPPGDPVLVDGDDTTGFWRRPGGSGTAGLDVEAYSWGQLTQGGKLGKKDFQRAAWAILLPFALINVALWATPATTNVTKHGPRNSRVSSFFVRLLALSLTTTFALALAGLSINEVAWQCRAGCARNVPGTGFLRDGGLALGTRPIAIAMIFPLLVIGLIALIAGRSFRYEAQVSAHADPSVIDHPFQSPHFWSGDRQIKTLARMHLTVAVAAVGMLAAGGAIALSSDDTCKVLCWIAMGVLAAATVLGVVMLGRQSITLRTGPTAKKHPWWHFLLPWHPLALAGYGFVLTFVALVGWYGNPLIAEGGPNPHRFPAEWPGFAGAISALFYTQVAVMIILVMLAVGRWWTIAIGGGVLAIGVLAVIAYYRRRDDHDDTALQVAALIVTAVLVLVVLVAERSSVRDVRRDPDVESIAWRGKGAALMAGAGVMLAIVYCSSALFALANWLNGKGTVTGLASHVVIPTALLWSGLGLFAAVLGLMVVGTLALLKLRALTKVALSDPPDEDGLGTVAQLYARRPGAPLPAYELPQAGVVAKARSLHLYDGYHAIGALGRLAAVGLAIYVGGAVVTMLGYHPTGPGAVFGHLSKPALALKWATDVGGSFSALLVFVIGFLLLNIYREKGVVRRVFGVVWDLATFWPRGAHPFAPPCYAERTVPELVTKLHGQRGVILATHSQGCLIGAAALFHLQDISRIRLLTFGCQFSRLYGRIFPLYFGPHAQQTLSDHLRNADTDHRWISLWRPTDYLGWKLDGPAEDIQVRDPVALHPDTGMISLPPIHKHSDYPLSQEYVQARDGMLASLRGSESSASRRYRDRRDELLEHLAGKLDGLAADLRDRGRLP